MKGIPNEFPCSDIEIQTLWLLLDFRKTENTRHFCTLFSSVQTLGLTESQYPNTEIHGVYIGSGKTIQKV